MKLVTVFFLVVSFGEAFAQAGPVAVADVSVSEFKHLMDSLTDEVIVDLRTPEELKQQGKIAGALEIDFFGAEFEPAVKALDKSKLYLLYCAGGGRSGETAQLMKELGFKKIYNLKDGFKGWAKQRMPVEKK